MPHGKDDNENKGRKSGKGPKLSKGMKKAARKEKKAVKKQSKRAKKAVKSVAKEIGKVSRFVGSQPPIGKVAKAALMQPAPIGNTSKIKSSYSLSTLEKAPMSRIYKTPRMVKPVKKKN